MNAAYVFISVISLLFSMGSVSIIYSIFFEIERPAQYNCKPKNKTNEIILDVSLLSGIDITDNDSDVHAEFDEVD
jgi:hypothetical protein